MRAVADPDVLYEERRRPSWLFVMLLLTMPAALVVLVFTVDLRWPDDLPVLAGLLGFEAFIWFLFAGPLGTELRHLRVDPEGLRVGRRLLPAGEIGRRRVVPAQEASAATWTRRIDGYRIGWSTWSYNPKAEHGPAVFVHQRRQGLRRPGWLIATSDPDGLLDALDRLAPATAEEQEVPTSRSGDHVGVATAGTITMTVLLALPALTRIVDGTAAGILVLLGLTVVAGAWIVLLVRWLRRRR